MKKTYTYLILIASLLAFAIFIIDINTGLGVATGVPYVAVVLISLWSPLRRFVVISTILCSVLIVVGLYVSRTPGDPIQAYANGAIALCGIWIAAGVCYVHSQSLLRLRENQIRTQTILDTAAEGIITIDVEGRIESFNVAAERIFGWSSEEVVGVDVAVLMPLPYSEEHGAYIKTYIETGTKKVIGIGREVLGKRRDGSTFPLNLTVSEVCLDDRRFFTAMVRDMTALKKVQSLASLGELSVHIAHEIKNPIAGIQNVMEVFADAFDKDEDRLDLVMEVKHQLKMMDALVRDLLTFARPGTLEKVLYNLRSLVNEVFSFSQNDPVMDHVQVTKDYQVELPEVYLDPSKMSQVFLNIILNAAISIRDEKKGIGTIHVAIHKQGSNFEITFRDNGPGIAEERLSKIFDPFFTTRSRGSGLGLTICKKITEQHDGSIHVESGLGEGTTFTILLPAVESDYCKPD